MLMIDNKHVLPALAFAISEVEKNPLADYKHIRVALYHTGWWSFHLVLSHHVYHTNIFKTYKFSIDSLLKNFNLDLQHNDIPFQGIDEALALADFCLSNRPEILTAYLFSLKQSTNLWCLRYKCETVTGQSLLIKVVIDTNSGMIVDTENKLLNTQKDTD